MHNSLLTLFEIHNLIKTALKRKLILTAKYAKQSQRSQRAKNLFNKALRALRILSVLCDLFVFLNSPY